jgi:transcriptional regulator with XRE-family HTH domain
MGMHENNRSALAYLLRKYIQPNQEALIAERLGKSVRTVEAYRYGETLPSADDMLALYPVLGPAFVNELLATVGMGRVRWLNKDANCPHKVLSKTANAAAVLADALQDKRIDHIEAPKVEAAYADLAEAATDFRVRAA